MDVQPVKSIYSISIQSPRPGIIKKKKKEHTHTHMILDNQLLCNNHTKSVKSLPKNWRLFLLSKLYRTGQNKINLQFHFPKYY